MVASSREQGLWQAWQADKAQAARARLFFYYADWARLQASRLYVSHPHPLAEWADYMQLASMGLLKAIDGFEPDRQSDFKVYAKAFVKGEIFRGLACYVRDKRNTVQERLVSSTQDEEVAFDELVGAVVDLAFGCFLELGIIEEREPENGPAFQHEQESLQASLMLLVERLPNDQQHVIVGHYYQYLPFKVIAELMELSPGRVSQLHAIALKQIRSAYADLQELNADW